MDTLWNDAFDFSLSRPTRNVKLWAADFDPRPISIYSKGIPLSDSPLPNSKTCLRPCARLPIPATACGLAVLWFFNTTWNCKPLSWYCKLQLSISSYRGPRSIVTMSARCQDTDSLSQPGPRPDSPAADSPAEYRQPVALVPVWSLSWSSLEHKHFL